MDVCTAASLLPSWRQQRQFIYLFNYVFIFNVLLTVHLSVILVNDQLDAQLFYFTYIIRLLQSSTRRAHYQEVKFY